MNTIFQKLASAFKDPTLRRRGLFVLLGFAIFRFGGNIPIPGVNKLALESAVASNGFFGLLNIFSGGGIERLSIFMLGVGPYITASIIMQLFTMIFPSLKAMYQEEGEAGRRKFSQYSRLLAVPLAMIQGFSLLTLLSRQGVLVDLTGFDQAINVLVVTAGAILVMWIAELMTEFGIGNGMSLLIFGGIVAGFPAQVAQFVFVFDPSQVFVYAIFLAVALAVIYGVVVVNEAERPIPITYAKRIRGGKVFGGASTYLPLRLNQSGVMPIIFALSIMLFPSMIGTFLATSRFTQVQDFAGYLLAFTNNLLLYGVTYFILVFIFTYFYTAITFDPDQISENLQKSGAFISGVRPGKSTAQHLGKVITRITLVGALFLGFVAVLPIAMQSLTGIQVIGLGGTSLLIVVSVVIELLKQLEAQLSMREY